MRWWSRGSRVTCSLRGNSGNFSLSLSLSLSLYPFPPPTNLNTDVFDCGKVDRPGENKEGCGLTETCDDPYFCDVSSDKKKLISGRAKERYLSCVPADQQAAASPEFLARREYLISKPFFLHKFVFGIDIT